jgi:hypothetical protein
MNEDRAKQRFLVMQLTRLAGLATVMLGIANVGGKLLPGLSPYLGYGLLIIGAVDFFLVPIMLKRAWQKQDQ